MKIAIVTGASSGMGREFVKQIEHLYKELDEIWVVARRKERLEELKSQLLTNVRIIDVDLLLQDSFEQIEQLLSKKSPNIRMLVNAAGFGKAGKVMELSSKEQLEMLDLNCRALTQMAILCIPYMNQGSRIINLASAAAFCPQPSFCIYAATKSYVLSFSRSLRAELADKHIYVTAVCPGPVDTEFLKIAGQKKKNNMKAAVMVKAYDVVKKALLDAKAGKEVSIYGVPMKMAKAATKVIPHSLILKGMKNMW